MVWSWSGFGRGLDALGGAEVPRIEAAGFRRRSASCPSVSLQALHVLRDRGDLVVGERRGDVAHHLVRVAAAAAVAERLELVRDVERVLTADRGVLGRGVAATIRAVASGAGRGRVDLAAAPVELAPSLGELGVGDTRL